ncbi:nitrate- and nitrite sensing domain-containing protein [Streptomyces sp. NPDC057702]|uniref:nitrate- and nitrite sensing domain-containing protein n=1 Tax=unclassified Streptomyces TaxID=2593676 RepID=UPI003694BD2C
MSITVVAATVVAAGAPVIVTANDDVHEAQRRVDRAEAAVAAVALAHSLADERDAMTEYVATGRSAALGAGASKAVRARVDRQIGELRGSASDASVTFANATKRLGDLPRIRQRALSGPGSAAETFEAYTGTVRALHRAAGVADPGVLGPLGRVVEQASGSRALLLGALASGGRQPDLTAAAQRTRLGEEVALADLTQTAPRRVRERHARAVSGAEVAAAERYLDRLTDAPRLSADDLALDRERVATALTARIDRMRGVETALTADGLTRTEGARDDEVTALELRAALLLACLLLAVVVGLYAIRSVTRPLAALGAGARRLAEDPAGVAPVTLGRRDAARGDEFASVVVSLNALHEGLGSQRARVAKLAAERGHLIEERQHLAAQIAEVRQECEELRRLKDEVESRLSGLRDRVHSSFVNLALRTLGLVERQLAVIETMEESEQDPERLDTLFTIDHLATGMRRYSENLLVIAGSERQSNHPGPVSLLDVLRAAISEVERYQRVRIQALPPQAQVAGFAADSVSHLVAELLENATVFSPPSTEVLVSGWLMESGEVMLSVQDEGIGMTADRFEELNTRLADPVPDYCQGPQPADPLGLGLYVVTRLAARHGVRVQLREQKQGGVTAVVVLPRQILPEPVPAAGGVRPVVLRTDAPGPASGGQAQLGAVAPAALPPESRTAQARPALTDHPDAYDPAASRTAHEPVAHEPVAAESGAEPMPHAAPARRPPTPGAPGAHVPAPRDATARPATPRDAAPHDAVPRDPASPGPEPYGLVPPGPAAESGGRGAHRRDARGRAESASRGADGARGQGEAYDQDGAGVPRGATFTGPGTATRVSGVASAPDAGDRADGPPGVGHPTGRRRGQGPRPAQPARASQPAQSPSRPAQPGGREHPEHYRPGEARPMPWTGEPWGPGPEEAPARTEEPEAPGPGAAALPPASARDGGQPDEPWDAPPRRARGRGTAGEPSGPSAPGARPSPPAPRGAEADPTKPDAVADRAGGPERDPMVVAAERAIERSTLREAASPSPAGPESVDPWPAPAPYAADARPADPATADLFDATSLATASAPDGAGPGLDGAPAEGFRATWAQPDQAGTEGFRAAPTRLDESDADALPHDGPRTDKGLPKRTPRVVAPRRPVPGERGKVDAEALRQRLGGFQRGARDGRRDAETEIAERIAAQRGTAPADQPDDRSPRSSQPEPPRPGSLFGQPSGERGLRQPFADQAAPWAGPTEPAPGQPPHARRAPGGSPYDQSVRDDSASPVRKQPSYHQPPHAEPTPDQGPSAEFAHGQPSPAPPHAAPSGVPARSQLARDPASHQERTYDPPEPSRPATHQPVARQSGPGEPTRGRAREEAPGAGGAEWPAEGQVSSGAAGEERSDPLAHDEDRRQRSSYDQERYDQPPHGRPAAERQPGQGHTQHQAGALGEGETVEEARS